MNRPIVVGVDPVHEDPEPLALASAFGELTGATIVAIAVHHVHELPTGLVPLGYDALIRARAAGSVADGVLNGAASPVAVAPRGYQPPGAITRVGVGLADTGDGRAAMAAAAAIASRAGAILEVLRAVQPVDWTGVAPPGNAYREALALARDAAAQAARATADELAPGVEAIVHAVVESPLAVLMEASARLDLLVCGSRGYGPLRRVLLGSVSRPLSHEARCPLVVVPRGAAADVERVFSEDGRVAEA